VQEVNPEEAEPVLNKVRHMKYASRIEGVAGTIKDNEEFQSVDRLVDVMQGEEFCLLLVAKALQPDSICELEQTLQEAYTTVSPLAKYSLQEGSSEGTSKSKSWTKGENSSSSVSQSKSTGENKGWSKGISTNNSVSTTTSSSSGGVLSSLLLAAEKARVKVAERILRVRTVQALLRATATVFLIRKAQIAVLLKPIHANI
jgi:hypothetical protein